MKKKELVQNYSNEQKMVQCSRFLLVLVPIIDRYYSIKQDQQSGKYFVQTNSMNDELSHRTQ